MSYSGTTFTKTTNLSLGCAIIALLLVLALLVGHICNIVQVIIWACGDAPALTVYAITKIVAVFVPLLGSIMGYVGFFH